MHRAVCCGVIAFGAVVGAGFAGARSAGAPVDRDTWTGQASVTWDALTDTTVVSVDVDFDGEADAAFRLQRSGPVPDYVGPARIAFRRISLAVIPWDGGGTRFVVAGHEAEPTAAELLLVPVAGLAFFPHPPATRAEDVFAALTDEPCRESLLPERDGCTECEYGGQGSDSCGLPGGESCSVTCMEGMYACCKTPDQCRCCDNIETVTVSHVERR